MTERVEERYGVKRTWIFVIEPSLLHIVLFELGIHYIKTS